MPIFDAGLFALMTGSAFLILLVSFKIGALLKALAGVIFLSLAIVLLAGYDVAYIEEISGASSSECPTANPCTTTKFIISDNGEWLGWIFMAFGIFALLLFILEMMGMMEF